MITKKSAEAPSAINIEQIADLYLSYNTKMKALEKQIKPLKEELLNYAKTNAAKFDGTALEIGNGGLYVEKRQKQVDSFDEEKMSMEWIEKMIDNHFGDMISVSIDSKKAMAQKDGLAIDFLKEIDYNIEVKEIFAVCTTK